MAACSLLVATADTGNTPNTSGAFTPTLGDLLVAIVIVSDSVQDPGNLTSSIGGFTFSQVIRSTFNGSAQSLYIFVADALVSDTSSQTVTIDNTSDQGTGSIIFVFAVSGMTKSGSAAIRQSAKQDNQAAGTTPAPAFGSVCLSANPTIGAVGNRTNPAGLTPPTNWTEPASGDTGYNTPTMGGEVIFRDSGFDQTSITWGSSSATAYGSVIVELDSSGNPFFTQLGAAYI